MIKKIVVLKVHRGIFPPFKPAEVMLGYFSESGAQQGSVLVDVSLFDANVREGQEVNFKKEPSYPFYDLGVASGPDAIG